jgi:hypothetical protein
MSGEDLLFYKEAKEKLYAGTNTAFGLSVAVGADVPWQAMALKPSIEGMSLDKEIYEIGNDFGTVTPESFLHFIGYPLGFAALTGLIYYLWMKQVTIPAMVEKQIELEKTKGLGFENDAEAATRRKILTDRLLEQEWTNAKYLMVKLGLSIAFIVTAESLVLDLVFKSQIAWENDIFSGFMIAIAGAAGVCLAYGLLSSKEEKKATKYMAEQYALFVSVAACGGAYYGLYKLALDYGSGSLEYTDNAGWEETLAEVGAVLATLVVVYALFKYALPHLTAGFTKAIDNKYDDTGGTTKGWFSSFGSDCKAFGEGLANGLEIEDDKDKNGYEPSCIDGLTF